jgi:hypothetical protein
MAQSRAGLQKTIKALISKRFAAELKASNEPNQWHDSHILWGLFGAFLAFALLAVGILMPTVWIALFALVVAWIFWVLSLTVAFRDFHNTSARVIATALLSVMAGIVLIGVAKYRESPADIVGPLSRIEAMVREIRNFLLTTKQQMVITPRNTEADRLAVEQAVAINNFIGGKNEDGLRNLFAVREMIDINIQLYQDGITEHLTGKKSGKADYVKGRRLLVDKHIGKFTQSGGGILADFAYGDVPLIILPETYTTNEERIVSYLHSGTLPKPILGPLNAFYSIAQDNANLLIHVMNDALHKSPDYFLQYDDVKSPLWRMIDKLYFEKFKMLQPPADEVVKAVRAVIEKP